MKEGNVHGTAPTRNVPKHKQAMKRKKLPENQQTNDTENFLDDLFGGLKKAEQLKQMVSFFSNMSSKPRVTSEPFQNLQKEHDEEKKAREETKKRKNFAAKARAERESTGTLSSAELVKASTTSDFEFQEPSVHRVAEDGLPVYKYDGIWRVLLSNLSS
jgi:hypothetical protein